MQELEWYVDGYKTKDALQKHGLRRIYHILYNVNSKKPLRTAQALHKVWPLYIDDKVEGEELLEEDDLRNHYVELRKKAKENDERSRATNNTDGRSGQGDSLPQ